MEINQSTSLSETSLCLSIDNISLPDISQFSIPELHIQEILQNETSQTTSQTSSQISSQTISQTSITNNLHPDSINSNSNTNNSITESIKNKHMEKYINGLIDNAIITLPDGLYTEPEPPNFPSLPNVDQSINQSIDQSIEFNKTQPIKTIESISNNCTDCIPYKSCNLENKINLDTKLFNEVEMENTNTNAKENKIDNMETLNNLKHNVSFSSADLQELALSSLLDNKINTNSLNTASDHSYTKIIKNIRHPSIIPPINNKNIRVNYPAKKHRKDLELDVIDYIYNKLQDYTRYVSVTISNYMLLITKAMEIIEGYDNLNSKTNKKDIVIKALNRLIIVDLDLTDFDKKVFLSTLSNFIELIIMCSKKNNKELNISVKDRFNSKNDNIDDIVLASCGQIIHSLIDKLCTIVIKNQYTAERITANIPTMTEILMLLADKYDFLTGVEKKNVVIQALHIFIKNKLEYILELDNDTKEEIIKMLDCIPTTIDLFISLEKQKYKINKRKRVIKIQKHKGFLKSIFASKQYYEEE